MDATDLKISRRLKKIMARVERLVAKEIGEQCGCALIVFPFSREGEASRIAEYQYICNVSRDNMRGALKAISDKWESEVNHVAPHERGLN